MDDVIYMKRLINNNLSLPKIKMYLRSYKNSDCKTLYISFFFKPHLFKIKCIRIRRYLCIKFHLIRYKSMEYRRCGKSGLKLPALSLGLWHNFGDTAVYENMRKLCTTAFDNGITHFDLANNYGPRPGAAEENFKKILKDDLGQYRDELIISTKAGYTMWDGPYGDWGSRKYLLASLDQSLKRMGLEYVDIFYHHRMDPDTPLEETMGALATAVSSGKALYVGLSNYNGEKLKQACAILEELHVPFVINQNRYSIFERDIENNGLKEAVKETQKGLITLVLPQIC